jgi:hypothetical protein
VGYWALSLVLRLALRLALYLALYLALVCLRWRLRPVHQQGCCYGLLPPLNWLSPLNCLKA